ncbi:ras-related protein Rab-34 isoform X2 [Heliangelus exortis]|uniref:ras-related protein Rab-34 isoform X2 n=1 Tax=Heliangelus exortis TaxID=472823 RepID=UPI003A930FC0
MLGMDGTRDRHAWGRWDTGLGETWGQPHLEEVGHGVRGTATWGPLAHGESGMPYTGMPHLGYGDNWDMRTVVSWCAGAWGMSGTWEYLCPGVWGQLHLGTWRRLEHGDSHTRGDCDTGTAMLRDMGTVRTRGQLCPGECGENRDKETAPLGDTGTAVLRDAVHRDSWDTGTSPLPLSPALAVALSPSPLPPATQAAPLDDERAGSGPQGQGHRRPAPVFSEGGRPARPSRLPPHGGQRLPGAADRHRGVSWSGFGDPPSQSWLGDRFKISKIIVVGDLSVGKTCLINRFCKDTFDKNYKATIGVDFEMERFEVLGIPFSLQLWDTAGQERFKCIASTYYRGAQAIVIVFDVNDVASLEHTRQWLADALKENDPSNVILFLVGSKKDLSTPAQYSLMEKDALKVAQEMQAEYWAVSSLTGENVRDFFFRVAALTFESSVLAELERSSTRKIGDTVRISSNESDLYQSAPRKKPKCCQ